MVLQVKDVKPANLRPDHQFHKGYNSTVTRGARTYLNFHVPHLALRSAMTVRQLVWIDGHEAGWICSNCSWKYPIPTLLSSKDARDAYDRLAASKFGEHKCQEPSPPQTKVPPTASRFSDRARILILRGYTPKVAVEIVLHELEFEHRTNPAELTKARADAEEFLVKIRKGLI